MERDPLPCCVVAKGTKRQDLSGGGGQKEWEGGGERLELAC
jgi:hypothetical protein